MQCIKPLKAGFDRTGDLVYSSKKLSKELVSFAFPCRKCLPCRLNQAREKAIRCVHEASMHQSNIFLTLTYDDQHIGNGRLNYEDFQLFMKKLRETQVRDIHPDDREDLSISFMVTGEYGDKTKRPHWHAIIFNYEPTDKKKKYVSDRGEQVYTSDFLKKLWGKGNIEFGAVTIDSAGYVARYAAKKLSHGNDQDHDFHPIHKTSSKNAIGKTWIQKYFKHTFENGFIIINHQKTSIPRFYLDWYKKNYPEKFCDFLSTVRKETLKIIQENQRRDEIEFLANICNYKGGAGYPLNKSQVKHTILKRKFKLLQERLKL